MRPSRILEVILVLMVLPTSTVWAQQVIYGCVKNNNGQMRIVAAGEACLPSEHAVQWQAGSAGTTSPPPAPSTPTPLLRVVDATDAEVGLLASPNKAARLEGDVWAGLPVRAAGLELAAATSLQTFYQSADCSGDPYLPVDMMNMLRTGLVIDEGGVRTFWYAGKPDVDRSTIQSVKHYNYGLLAWACDSATMPASMPLFGRATTLDVSGFVAPFKVVQK